MSHRPLLPIRPTSRPVVETMEDRILHSADFAPAGLNLGGALVAHEQRVETETATDAVATQVEIAFVDARAPAAQRLPEAWAADATRRVETVAIGADEDGLSRIAEVLAGREGIAALHLAPYLTADGGAALGSSTLDAMALFTRAGEVADWSAALRAAAPVTLHGTADAAAGFGHGLVALTGLPVATLALPAETDATPLAVAFASASASTTASAPEATSALPAAGAFTDGTESKAEIVFVDLSIPDAEQLIADLHAQAAAGRAVEIVRIAGDEDGIARMSAVLAGRSDLAAVHVLSHGSAAAIQLGNTRLDAATLAARGAEIAAWSTALADDADLLFYGCDVASSPEGLALIDRLADLTGADVAASTDLTGAAAAGGNWTLEYAHGRIETAVAPSYAARWAWTGLLATYVADPGKADGALGSLRWAVDQANSNAGPDTVQLLAGTHLLTLPGKDEVLNASGDINVRSDIAFVGASTNPADTVVRATTFDRVFHIVTANVSFSGLTIQGGRSSADGGGVLNDDKLSALVFTDVDFIGNQAVLGGAMRADSSSTATRVRFLNNTANDNGAAHVKEAFTGTDLVFSNNHATTGNGGAFGGQSTAPVTLTRVTFANNTAAKVGGAIDGGGINLVADQLHISGNVAGKDGGGIAIGKSSSITNSTIAANSAETGGGIAAGASLTATSVTLSGNTATLAGGGVHVNASGVTLRNATIVYNSAPAGGGVYSNTVAPATPATLTGSLLAANTGGNANTLQNSGGHNIDTDGTAVSIGGTNLRPSVAAIRLGPLANNGGYAPTHALFNGSVAIDVGSPSSPATDQRGAARIRQADIGAFEARLLVVDTTSDSVDGDVSSVDALVANRGGDGRISLREAILAADATTGLDTVFFDLAGGGVQSIALASALPTITDYIYIDGNSQSGWSGAPLIQLDGSAAGAGVAGLNVLADGSTIRGLIFSSFGGHALALIGANNTIRGNWIGTNANGSAASGNGGDGIYIASSGNVIGGTGANAGNVISGNVGAAGIELAGAGATGNVIQGNTIGLNAAATAAIGNLGAGVLLSGGAAGNTIGGTAAGAGNTIAHSGGAGVRVLGNPAGNAILGNSIHTNAGLGIDLGPAGVNANDGLKTATQANLGMDSPVTTVATLSGSTLLLAGHVGNADSQAAFANARVEFFKADADPSGYGEGRNFLGTLTTDSQGNYNGFLTVTGLAAGDRITGTATDAANNTSEFGANFAVIAATANARPTLAGANAMSAILEDAVSNGGTLVSALVAAQVGDADANAQRGIAVTGADNSNGVWQYSRDNGGSWNAFGAPTTGAARLLAGNASTFVRFVPNANWNGVFSGLSFRAWDQTGFLAGSVTNTNTDPAALDRFSTVSYGNNDGTQAWTSGWVETERTAGNSPAGGDVLVTGNRLEMRMTTAPSAIYREINLAGALSGTLSFAYTNTLNAGDVLAVQVSNNGGASYTTLSGGTFTNALNTGSGTLSFDIGAFLSATTRIRFQETSTAMGGTIAFDDVQVASTTPASISAPFSAVIASASLTVIPVNDAPQGTSKSVATLEDTAYAFTVADFGYSDPVDGGANALLAVKISTLPATGSLTLSGVAVTAGQFVSAASINAGALRFTPTLNSNGVANAAFTFQVQDDGGTVNGGVELDATARTMTINVTAVNDPPVGVNRTVGMLEDGTYSFTLADFPFSDPADSPANTLLNVKITTLPTLGTLKLGAANVTAGQLIAAGSVANLRYTPALHGNGTGYSSFTFQLQDNGGTVNGGVDLDPTPRTFTFDVTSVNDAPVGTAGTITALEDVPYVLQVADFGYTDPADSPAPNNFLAVKITAVPGKGSLKLSGVNVAANQLVSVADIAAGNLSYTGVANANGNNYTTFRFAVQDDGGTANGGVDLDATPRTMTVNVTPVNDAPVGANKTVTTLEDTAYTFTTADFTLSDPLDTPADVLLAVKVTTLPATGSLTLSGVGVTAGQYVSAVDIGAGKLRYLPAQDANGTGIASFTFQVQDDGGTANGGVDTDTTPRSLTFTVTAVNDAPIRTAGPTGPAAVLEDAAATSLGLGSLAYVPGPTPDEASQTLTYRVTTVPLAALGVVTLVDGTTVVTANTAYTLAQLQGMKFRPTANVNGSGGTLAWTVTDNGGIANSGVNVLNESLAIQITPVNDAPVGANKAVAAFEDTPYTFVLADFPYTDPSDTPADALAAVKITTLPTAGSLQLSGAAVTAGQFVSAADIVAGTLRYLPPANVNGNAIATFTFQVQDAGGTANGGSDLDATARTLTVNATAVNDAPVGTPKTVTLLEDSSYPFTVADFGFTDPSDSPANTLLAVKISTLPGLGSLTLSGGAVSTGQFIPVAAITAGALRYTPPADANGAALTSFTFQVQDNGGTANGGVDLDATPRAMTLTVTPVNDAPVRTGGTVTPLVVLEDAGATTLGLGGLAYGPGPADESAQTLSYRVSAVPLASLGTVTLVDATTAVTANTAYTLAQIQGMKFRAAPNANGGPATFAWTVTDSGGTAGGGNDTLTETLAISVTSVNDAPSGNSGTVVVSEDVAYALRVADFGFSDANDTPANALLSVTIATQPTAGRLTLNGDTVNPGTVATAADITAGKLVFVGAQDANGIAYASFGFRVRDDGGTANGGIDTDPTTRTLTFDVTPVDDAPRITSLGGGATAATSVAENSTAVVAVTAVDVEGDAITFSISGGADAARFAIDANTGVLRFLVAPNFEAPNDVGLDNVYDVIVRAADAGGAFSTQAIAVTVTDVAGVAGVNSGTLWFSTALASSGGGASWTAGQIAQFGDAGDRFTLNGGNTGGTISVLPGYAPPVPLRGLHYVQNAITIGVAPNQTTSLNAGDLLVVLDPGGAPATVVLNGTTFERQDIAVFRPTVAGNYSSGTYSMLFDNGVHLGPTTYNVHAITLVERDTMVGGTLLTAGTFLVAHSTPAEHMNVYAFTATGTGIGANTKTSDSQLLLSGTTLGNAASQVQGLHLLTQQTAFNDNTLAAGTLLMTINGSNTVAGVAQTPYDVIALTISKTMLDVAPATAATATMLFKGADIGLTTGTNIGSLTVVTTPPPNTPPTITSSNSASTPENTTVVQALTASDPDGQIPVFSIVGGDDAARFTIDGSNRLTFLVAPDFEAPTDANVDNVYIVRIRASDGVGGITEQVVSVTVANVNETPVAAADAYTTDEDTALIVAVPQGLLANDSDPDGDVLSAVLVTGPASGALLLNGNGSFSYTPNVDFNGVDSFTYRASDGALNSAATTVTITVRSVNDAPRGSNATVVTLEDTPYTFKVADFGYSDPKDTPANALAFVRISTLPGSGALTLSGVAVTAGQEISVAAITAGNLRYASPLDANGTGYASLGFQVRDNGGTAFGGVDLDPIVRTLSIDVTPVNDPPVLVSHGGVANVALSVPENSTAVTTVAATDVDADVLTYSITGGLDALRFNVNASTGALSFKVAPNYEAPSDSNLDNIYNVTVRAADPSGTFVSQTFNVTVTDVYGVPGQPSGVLWFSTTDSGSATGASWSNREVLQFGSSDDYFDINGGLTAGTIAKLPGFVAPATLRGMHYVETTLTIGGGGTNTQFTLNPGDLVLVFNNDGINLNTGDSNPYNDFTADKKDIVVYRPTVAGNYASGSYAMLLNNGVHRSGSDRDVFAMSLVESDTLVGGTLLKAGTFLVAHEGGAEDSNIYTVTATSTGIGALTTTADRQLLLLGSGLGITAKIQGLHLLTHDTAFNDTLLAKGTLLLAIDSTNTVGGTSMTNVDVVALTVTKTQQDASPGSVATGVRLFDGSDLGLTSGNPKNLGGFTVASGSLPTNTAPTIVSVPVPTVLENSIFVATLSATDPEGGPITYSIVGGSDRAFFSIVAGNQLYFTAAPDFETPLDATSNNQYQLQIRATDNVGASSEQLFLVMVTNVNEAPVANPDSDAATQDVTRSVGAGTGVLANDTDVDAGDTKTVSAVTFGATSGSVGTGLTGTYGTFTLNANGSYTYLPSTAAAKALARNQTAVESFGYTVRDAGGLTGSSTITFTITGVNDPVTTPVQNLSAAVTELTGTPTGNLSDSNVITFADLDLNDVHTVSPTGTPVGSVLGTLTAVKNSDTTGTGTGGQLTWTYSVAASAVEYLAAGQTKVESFDLSINDGNGSLITRRVTATITGTNDPVLISSGTFTGGVTELVTPTGNLSTNGAVFFSDADVNDTHTVAATGTPVGSVLGALTAVRNNDTTNGVGGKLTWTYSVAATAVEYLAAGQTKVDSFTVRIDDGKGGAVLQQIDITITGTNDAPQMVTQKLTGSITELVSPAGNLSDTGTITFSDVDLTDVHTVTPNGTPIGSVLGALTAVKDSDTTGTGTGGKLTWTYTVAASAIEYLAAGQTKVESFTISVNDGNGGVLNKQIDVTITGTNDVAVITAEQLTGGVTEMVTPSGNLSDSGSIFFTDVDLNDVHTVTPTGTVIGTALGSLTAVKNSDTTGTGTGGKLTWTYTVAASAVEYLAAGQTKLESFDITLSDGKGGNVTKRIAITLTGTNDAPLIATQQLTGAITESVTPVGNLTDSGVITFTDVDLNDVHTVTPNGTAIGSVLGALTAVKNTDTTGTGTGGKLTWTYTVAASAIEYLAAGQTKVESFTIALADGNGGVVNKQIDVTITGTNDVAVITAEQLTGGVTEMVTPSGNLSDSGSIFYSDVDLNDVHTVTPTGTAVGTGVLGALTAVKNTDTTGTGTGGKLTWTYTVAASAVEYLAAGQTKLESFDITLSDGKGGNVTKRIAITITGTNDAPLIATQQLTGSIAESITPVGNLTDSGVITFTDVDLNDVHTVTPNGTAIGSVLGSLTAVKNTDTTGTGTGGKLTWTYTVAASAIEYLAAGQVKVESFTISVNDGNGGVVNKQIDVTITGTNDVAVITAEQLTGSVLEQITPSGNLTDSGTIEFIDVDLNDVHTVTPTGTPVGTGVLGALTAVKNSDTTGSGGGGKLTWTYTVAASAIEYLAAGQTKLESFDITLSDGKGGNVAKRIAITLTGTNDAIVITSAQLTGAVTEAVTPVGNLTDSGVITFSDVDLSDVHTVSPNGTAIGSVLGSLTAVKNTDTTGTGTGGQLTWTYSVAASAVEYLAAGETKVESFTVSINDANGSLVTRQINVTITGTNDAPTVTAAQLSGAVTEMVTPTGNLTDTGTIAFADVDLSDAHTVTPTGTPVGTGVLGTLTAVKNTDSTGSGTGGQLTWTYTVAASAIEYLASGQTKVESFTVSIDDGKGGSVSRQIDVTITGTNDVAVITAEQLTGGVTEMVTPSGNLSDSGSIFFTDVDLNDVHTVTPNGTAVGTGVLGALTAVKNSDTTGTGTGGKLTWTYTVAASAVEYLAAGQTKLESFDITLSDGKGGNVTKRIDVTITGTNDAPLIATQQLTGAITESVTPVGSLTDSGVITFTDVDLADVHTVTPNGTAIGSVLGSLTAVKNTDTTGTGTGGKLTWTYTVAASAIEYLAAGQTKVESFTIALADGNGGVVNKQIDVTITGTNDVAVITAEQLTGGVTEMVTPSGNLSDSGSIFYTDVDLNDVHTVTPTGTAVGTGVLGSLTAVKNSDTTGTGTGGKLTWTYTVAASAVEYLAAGQTKLESFDITLSDGKGGNVTKRIAITITGTNDAPLIATQQLTGAITESVTPVGNLSDSGVITFTDVDLNDVHTVTPNGTAIGSVLGSLTAVKNTDTTGTGTGGQLTWTYTVAASAIEYLAAGQTKVESFTIALADGNGGVVNKQIDVTITGTNDVAVITAEQLTGGVTEMVTPSGNLSDSGTIEFIDVDLNDVHTVTPTGTPVGTGVLGALTAVKNSDTTGSGGGGKLTWTYTVAASAIEYLAAGQTKLESFDITLSDGKGGNVAKRIAITLTGTNDAIVITSAQLTGAVTEAVTPVGNLTDSGVITFSDVDLSDVHTVSPNGTAIGSVLGSLTAVKNTDTTGTGTGGQLTWTYSVAASAVEYLAAGETKVESFTVSINDANGSLVTRQINVTITGTNDAVVVTSEELAAEVYNDQPLHGRLETSGQIRFSDADIRDVHAVSGTGTPIGKALGTLTAVKATGTTGTGVGGHITWTYAVDASAVAYLASDEMLVERFEITLDDQNGSSVTREIAVTVSGPNVAPVITGEQLSGTIDEQSVPSGTLGAVGSIEFSDINRSDVHRVSAAGTPVGEVLGSLSAVKVNDTTGSGTGGQLRWNYNVAASAVEYLAAGEARTERFDITLDDQRGGVLVRRIEITIRGSNDTVTVTAEERTGAVTESGTPVGMLSDRGTIHFSDVDLSDVHRVTPVGTPVGTTLGTLRAVLEADTTGTGSGGRVSWTYTVAASAIEYLAAGQTRVERFTIDIDDGRGSTSTRQIDVTLTGTNDAPQLSSVQSRAAITELTTPQGTLNATGTIEFDDVDLDDVHTVTPTGTAVGEALGRLVAEKLSDTTGTGTGGQLRWSYSVAASAVEYLAAGETRVERFDIALADGQGGVVTQRIEVTITGSNDAPVIGAAQLTGAASAPALAVGTLTASGRITFSDVDLSDVHTVSSLGTPQGSALGRLTAMLARDSTGTGIDGAVVWTYTVDAAAIQYLAAGELRVERFDLTLDDGHGGTVEQTIVVTLTGANDAIRITSEQLMASVIDSAEATGTLHSSGQIGFADPDLRDVHRVTPTGTPVGGTLGSLTAILAADTTGTATGGLVVWSYEVAASAIAHLAAGETRLERFTISLVDDQGSAVEREIAITLTGGNAAPTVAAAVLSATLVDPAAAGIVLTERGAIEFSDVDLSDVHEVRVSAAPGAIPLGQLTALRDADTTGTGSGGKLSWTYRVDSAAVQYLGAGQTRVDSFIVTIDDGKGGSVSRRVDVTLHGSNDAPVVNHAPDAQSLMQGVDFSFRLPEPTFHDADVDDHLSYTATLADGSALPSWLKFDARQLVFSGSVPLAANGNLVLRVTAIDSSGAAAVALFGIQVQVNPNLLPPLPVAAAAPPPAAPVSVVPAPAPAAAAPLAAPAAVALPARPVVEDVLAPSVLPNVVSTPTQTITIRRHEAASESDLVLAQALVADFATVQTNALLASLQEGDLLRKLDELRRQIEEQAANHQTAVASSIALTTGLSVGYVVWLVRGGLLLSSVLSAMPAWQMIDPLPVLSNSRGMAGGTDDDEESAEDVERLFGRNRLRKTPPIEPQLSGNPPISLASSTTVANGTPRMTTPELPL